MNASIAFRSGAALVACVLLLALPREGQGQDGPPPISGEVVLSETSGGVEARLVIRYLDPAEVLPELRAQALEEGGEEAVRIGDGGTLELLFAGREMDDVIPLLRRAREGVESLPVTIRIPAELRSADVWSFQARLSQAGIRQVRLVTDPSFLMSSGT